MPERLDELSRVLGGIESQLDLVLRTQGEDRLAAAQYRTDIRRELAETKDSIHSVQIDIRIVTDEVSSMKPTVTKLEEIRLMSAGATKLALIFSRAAHLIAGMLGGLAVFLLDYWTRKH